MANFLGSNYNDNNTFQSIPVFPFTWFYAQLDGTDDSDYFYGADGDDIIFGYKGADTLDGGLGADLMDGGYGNDIYYTSRGQVCGFFSNN